MYSTAPYTRLAEAEYLGEPQSGDQEMGVGVSTSQLQNPNVSLPTKTAVPLATGMWQWPATFIIIAVLLILGKVITEKAGKDSEFATVRIGLENFWVVGSLSVLFIFAMKMSAYLLKWAPAIQFFGFV